MSGVITSKGTRQIRRRDKPDTEKKTYPTDHEFEENRKLMNEAYAELATLRHVRVDGNAALEYLAEHVDRLVYELQLKKQKVEDLQASYTALNQVRLYFQNDYRDLELDLFRRLLNATVSRASNTKDRLIATKIRSLFDNAVGHCIDSEKLFQTNPVDAARWLKVVEIARTAAYQHHRTLGPERFRR